MTDEAPPAEEKVKRFASGPFRRTLAEELAWAELRMTVAQFAKFKAWANRARIGDSRRYKVPRLTTIGFAEYDCTRIE